MASDERGPCDPRAVVSGSPEVILAGAPMPDQTLLEMQRLPERHPTVGYRFKHDGKEYMDYCQRPGGGDAEMGEAEAKLREKLAAAMLELGAPQDTPVRFYRLWSSREGVH